MRQYIMIILLSIWGTFAIAHPHFESNNVRLDRPVLADSLHGFDVERYVIDLTIDDENEYIQGSVLATVLAEENLSEIEYELEGLGISSVEVNGQNAEYSFANGIISIDLDVNAGEEFTTKVFYSGSPSLSEGYNIGMIFRNESVFTISDPNAGRFWWPSYDHPWDKTEIDFYVTCRSDWVAACNGLQGQTTDNSNGTKTYEWIGENPMSTYLAVIHIGPYQLIEQTYEKEDGTLVPIQHFVQSNFYDDCLVDFALVPEMMETYASFYGEYPFEKYGQALVVMQTFGAMEHQTMTTLGTNFIDGEADDEEYTVAHELSHHWFGNCLTPLTWKDVWLSEGFAVYSEAVWDYHLNGYDSMIEYVNTDIQNYYKNWANSNGPQTIYDPEYMSYFSPPSYEKAASVLHMLRLEVGNDTFWEIIASWFENNKYSNVVTEEFIAHCESVSGLDLEQFFYQWIYSSGIPSYTYMPFINNDSNEIKFLNDVTANTNTQFQLTIPVYTESDSVNVKFNHGLNFSNTVSINGDIHQLEVDRDNWNLISYKSDKQLHIADVYSGNESALLSWTNDFDIEFTQLAIAGYNVYYKKLAEDSWTQFNTEPIEANQIIIDNLENGQEYHFYVTLVTEDGFQTLPSTETDIIAVPTEFSGIEAILLVDDTQNGTGSVLSPTDQAVDNFYQEILFAGYNVDSIDLDSEELTWQLISSYQAVIWYNESVSASSLGDYSTLLGNYLFSGGKLVISGWKSVLDIPEDFYNTFIGDRQLSLSNLPECSSFVSDLYPTLNTRPELLPSTWDGDISMITTFNNAENVLYRKAESNDAVAIYNSNERYELFLFGIPLYYMQENEVRSMMLSLLSNTSPPVENADDSEPALVNYEIYPNPAKGYLNIKSNTKNNPDKICLYNLKGQKIAEYNNLDFKDAQISLNLVEKKLANGFYFVKIYNKKEEFTEKIILLK